LSSTAEATNDRKVRTMRAEEDIKNDVVQSLYWDTRVDAADVTVEVRDSAVVLGGSVPTARARQAAQEDAEVIREVADVRNEIVVRHPTAAAIPTDAEIRDRIRDRLDLDPDLDATDVTINVQDGWVILRGSVPRLWQKGLVDDIVMSERGVIGFANELAVVPTKALDDQMIADAITEELERRVTVDPTDIDVAVVDGFVTLNGVVPHRLTRSAAIATAAHTNGVIGVMDNLVIDVMTP
jgi:osmotically-inducible protein OsmY